MLRAVKSGGATYPWKGAALSVRPRQQAEERGHCEELYWRMRVYGLRLPTALFLCVDQPYTIEYSCMDEFKLWSGATVVAV